MPRFKQTARKSTSGTYRSVAVRAWARARETRSQEELCPWNQPSTNSARGGKKPHRYRPGKVALTEIRKCRDSGEFLIRPSPLQRLAKEIAEEFNTDSRFQGIPVIVQEMAEAYVIETFQAIYDFCVDYTKSVTALKPKDIRLARHFRGKRS